MFADPALSVGFLLARLCRLDDGHGHVVVDFVVDLRFRGVGRGDLCHCCRVWGLLGLFDLSEKSVVIINQVSGMVTCTRSLSIYHRLPFQFHYRMRLC